MKQKTIFLMGVGCLLFGLLVPDSYANIIVKVRALNPLESEEVAAIFYPLPSEVSPSDIIEKKITFSLSEDEEKPRKTTFNVEYVEEKGRYFIIDEVALGPREVVTLEVHVRDIWTSPAERLDSIKQTVEGIIVQYQPAEDPSGEDPESVEEYDEETIRILQDAIFEEIDAIAKRQPKSSVLKVGVEKHMEAYYEDMEALAQVEVDVLTLRSLLEPDEEEGEEGEGEGGSPEIEEGEAAEEEGCGEATGEEASAQEELPAETELLEKEIPLADPADLTFEDGAVEPEGNFAE